MAQKKRILVADDNADVSAVVNAMLGRDERFEILNAQNGEEALSLARMYMPDLILLDIMMPRVHGLKVCRLLKGDAKTAKIKIIMLSALGREYTRREAFQYGANAFVAKPFSPRELLESINTVMRGDVLPAESGGSAREPAQNAVFSRGDEVRVVLEPDQEEVGGIVKSRIPPGQWEENEWGYRVALDTGIEKVVKWDHVRPATLLRSTQPA